MMRKRFDAKAPFSVRFNDEDGVDNGGLGRELARLARIQMYKTCIFKNEGNMKSLDLNQARKFAFHNVIKGREKNWKLPEKS